MVYEEKRQGIKTWIWASFSHVGQQLKKWVFFAPSWCVSQLVMVARILVFFYMANFIAADTNIQDLQVVGNYAAYIIFGLIFHQFFSSIQDTFYNAYLEGYWGSTFEIYSMHPVGITAMMSGSFLFKCLLAFIELVVYMLIGGLVFGVNFVTGVNYIAVVVVVMAGLVPMIGLGLIGASTFTLLNVRQWGSNPVAWISNFLTLIFCGVYFPPSLLPAGLGKLATILPQTYLYDGMRLAFLKGYGLTMAPLLRDIAWLAAFGAFLLPVGISLMRMSLRKAEIDGSLSKWI